MCFGLRPNSQPEFPSVQCRDLYKMKLDLLEVILDLSKMKLAVPESLVPPWRTENTGLESKPQRPRFLQNLHENCQGKGRHYVAVRLQPLSKFARPILFICSCRVRFKIQETEIFEVHFLLTVALPSRDGHKFMTFMLKIMTNF